MNINELETNELKTLYDSICIELEKRAMQRTRLIDKSSNLIFRDGFRRHVPDKMIHIVRNDLNNHWKEIFTILDNYNVPKMKYEHQHIELQFDPNDLLYYEIMNRKEEIIEKIENLYQ